MGGLIHLSARAGCGVTLVCTTRGEQGEISDPALATPATLGTVREGELRAACALLGVHDVRFLDYRDSGMAGTAANADPRAYRNAPAAEAVAKLLGIIRAVRPTVVATWDPSGGYGHPDHIAACTHTTAAFDAASLPSQPELGEPHAPAALYYMARPREMREEVRAEVPNFVEVYVECPIEVLAERDVKGLYKKALAGEIAHFTGVSDPYEPPLNPEIEVHTDRETEDESAEKILGYLFEQGLIG